MTAINPFADFASGPESAAVSIFKITPDADNDLPSVVRWIYFNSNLFAVELVDTKGNTIKVQPPAGTTLGPFRIARVKPVGAGIARGLIGMV
jgi:hypothetical protein